MDLLDGDPQPVEEGDDAAGQNIHGVHRTLSRIDFGKGDAGIAVHNRFNIDASRSRGVANFPYPVEEKPFLEQRALWIGPRAILLAICQHTP
jgi:hypothetical protein